jgi:hypothetical protein
VSLPGSSTVVKLWRALLHSIGRRSESPKELIIELSGSTELRDFSQSYVYKVIGTPDQLTKAASEDPALKTLTDQLADITALMAATNLNELALREALESLRSQNKAVREGTGRKGSPFIYKLPD